MIKVMTDNAANLPPELRAQYAITELCLTSSTVSRWTYPSPLTATPFTRLCVRVRR